MTIREKLVQALEARGFRQVQYPTRKYIVMKRDDKPNLLFVGKAGALRIGQNVGNSYAVENLKARLLAGERV